MTKKEAVNLFKKEYELYFRKEENRIGCLDPLFRFKVWNCFTGRLHRNKDITDKQYDTWTEPSFCK